MADVSDRIAQKMPRFVRDEFTGAGMSAFPLGIVIVNSWKLRRSVIALVFLIECSALTILYI